MKIILKNLACFALLSLVVSACSSVSGAGETVGNSAGNAAVGATSDNVNRIVRDGVNSMFKKK